MSTAVPSIAAFDPRSPEYMRDPHAALQDLLRDAPVFYYEPLNAYYVLPWAQVRQVLNDTETFSSQSYKTMPVRDDLRDRIPHEYERVGQVIQGGQVHNMDLPEHTLHRKALQQTFTRKRVNQAKPDVARIANELIDELIDRGSCDLVQDFGVRLTLRVVTTMLDVPQELVAGFQAWIIDVFGILAPIDMKPEDVTTPDDQLVANYERVHAAYLTYSAFLEERRANPGDDLASAMLSLVDEDGQPVLSNDQVLGHMIGITAAGTDTTASLIVAMVRLFTEHPDQLELVLNDPELWDNAMAEGLRRSAIANQIFRMSTCETELAGVTIPARSAIALCLPAADADPEKFPDPLRFDVLRANAGEHLALGKGRHFCLGAPLVPPEARIALQTLYARLPDLKADLEAEREFVPSLAIRAQISQPVSWTV
jgi:cytochrome P450